MYVASCWRFVGDSWRDQLEHLAHRLGHVNGAPIYFQPISLDARYVEQVVDQVRQPIGGAHDDLDELPLARRHRARRALEQFDEPLDRRQRAPQLV